MRVDCGTDIGAVRSSNQDSCQCGVFPGGGAWAVVCDGMGGANGGNVASSLAVERIGALLSGGYREGMSGENLKSLLLNAVRQANSAVYDLSLEREELRGMGTTAVLLAADQGKLHVVHVGDSRAYLKNREGLSQITMDHSYVQDLVNLGQLTPEEARVHPQRNIITRVLGVYEEVQCDYSVFEFAPGDMALACSDGLTSYLDDALLLEYLERYEENGETLAKQLMARAVESGGSDNITAALISNG